MDQESELVKHLPCPCGTSSDGLGFFDDGHGFCFVCDTYFSNSKLKKEGVEEADDYESASDGDFETAGENNYDPSLLRGSIEALAKRRITEETCRKFGYIRAPFHGRSVHVAQIYDDQRRLVAQKLRMPDKSFIWKGDKNKAPGLYGKWLWKEGGKKVVITEGEIDALTVSQLQGNKWPVVSVLNGAAGAAKSIKKELQWLNSFDQVVLMFDNDDAGKKAIEKCVPLFPPGKVFIGHTDLKDANEMLLAGRGQEVIQAIWNAKEWRPDNILNAAELWDDFISEEIDTSIPYPWEGLNVKTMGLRKRELLTLTAGSGIGKSSVCRELAHWLLSQGEKVGYIALEENYKKTLQELVSIELNTRLIKAPKEGEGSIPEADMKEAFDRVVGSGNLYLFNHFGSLNSDRLIQHIRYLSTSLGVDWIFLDHLSIVVSGDDTITDERRGIDVAMTKLRSLVEETGIGMVLVSHLKRPDGKGHEEGAVTSLAQLRGSAAIAQLSDMVLGLERNQQDADNADRTQIRVLKNRFTGETGPACGLLYNHESGRLREEEMFDDETDDGDGY